MTEEIHGAGLGRCAGYGHHGRMGLMPCSRNGTIVEVGKVWCWQHAPSREAAKYAEAKAKRDSARAARENAERQADLRAEELTIALGHNVHAEPVYARSWSDIVAYRFFLSDERVEVEYT